MLDWVSPFLWGETFSSEYVAVVEGGRMPSFQV